MQWGFVFFGVFFCFVLFFSPIWFCLIQGFRGVVQWSVLFSSKGKKGYCLLRLSCTVGLSHTNNERAKVVQLLSECVLEPRVMTEKVRSPSLARGRWALSN